MIIPTDRKKINIKIAEHFNWGNQCDGWFLINQPNVCILQERMPAGAAEEKHYHVQTWQFFYILSGRAIMEIDAVIHDLNSSDGIEVPPQVPHKISNEADQDLIFLVISMPNHKHDRINI